MPAPDAPTPAPTHYIAVRRDLPRGLLAAQVTHAAAESAPGGPLPPGTSVVVLGLDTAELEALRVRLERAAVPHQAVIESDAPYTGQLMAIGLAPCARAIVRPFLRSLPLLC